MTQQGLPLPRNPAAIYRGLPMAALNLGGTTAVQFGAIVFFRKKCFRVLFSNFGFKFVAIFCGCHCSLKEQQH
jgi:uncharacterized integral membrane protein